MFPYLYQPGTTVQYVLKKITAIKNPDYLSKRAALGLQIDEAKRSFAVLKKAVPNEPNAINALQVIQARLESLSRAFEGRMGLLLRCAIPSALISTRPSVSIFRRRPSRNRCS